MSRVGGGGPGLLAAGPDHLAESPPGGGGRGRPAIQRGVAAARAAARSAPVRHLLILLCYLAAGVVLTWPRATYLAAGKLPATMDQGSYVWGLWWVAHQLSQGGNPWFTHMLAAPAGIRLGFDTLMPLPGVIMMPVTLLSGPSVSYGLLAIATPGLACYLTYRVTRLWLPTQLGALAAGACFGLSTMLLWQVWYHLNIALGALFLPLTLEAVVRFRRRPRFRQAVVLGLVLGTSFLVNQESGITAAVLAVAALVFWLIRGRSLVRLGLTALAVVVAVLAASPQLIAMAQQAAAGGASVDPAVLAHWDAAFGTPVTSMFAPSPRVKTFGLTGLGSLFQYRHPGEGIPTFGVILTLLAVVGLVAARRRASAWLLALLWVVAAALALGPVLLVGTRPYLPLEVVWHQVPMSGLLPYTWFVRIPGLAGFREADRFTLLGLLPAALLAGAGAHWLWRHARPALARPVLVIVLALAALEAGYSGNPAVGTMPAAMPMLDGPIAADHSNSIVVDVPYGLRGGMAPYGHRVPVWALVLAAEDGHPRAASYTSWIPVTSIDAARGQAFYSRLVAAQRWHHIGPLQIWAARQDARALGIGWAIVWAPNSSVLHYLRETGFAFDYQVGAVRLYRRAPDQAVAAGRWQARTRASSGHVKRLVHN